MNFINQLVTSSKAWLALAGSALALELCAFYFQYVLNLLPCIMCVYQRLAILAILLAGLIGAAAPKYWFVRLTAFALWGAAAIWGLLIALEHVEMQTSTTSFFFGCEIVPNFPSWAPLHEWLPFMFEASGDCGDIKWRFFGYSMPQVMVAVFVGYIAILAVMIFGRLIDKKVP